QAQPCPAIGIGRSQDSTKSKAPGGTTMHIDTQSGRRPLVGVIVPPAQGEVPPELPQLYGGALDFMAHGLALGRLTPEGYDAVIGKVEAAARALADRGADAVALMGSSLSFYRGRAFND